MSQEAIVLLAGLVLVTVGFSMAWLPLGPIVLGSLLLGGLVWTRLRVVRPVAIKRDDKA